MGLSWHEWNARLRTEAAKLGIERYSAIPLIDWWAMQVSPAEAAKLLKEKEKEK